MNSSRPPNWRFNLLRFVFPPAKVYKNWAEPISAAIIKKQWRWQWMQIDSLNDFDSKRKFQDHHHHRQHRFFFFFFSSLLPSPTTTETGSTRAYNMYSKNKQTTFEPVESGSCTPKSVSKDRSRRFCMFISWAVRAREEIEMEGERSSKMDDLLSWWLMDAIKLVRSWKEEEEKMNKIIKC